MGLSNNNRNDISPIRSGNNPRNFKKLIDSNSKKNNHLDYSDNRIISNKKTHNNIFNDGKKNL